jgi:hypothetical protein
MHAYLFLKRLFLLSLLCSLFNYAHADEKYSIFDVRKKLQMSNDEPAVKDYYISAGAETGLKPNMVVDVKRKIPMHDGFKNQSLGNLTITVGKLKIIHVDSGLSVARLFHVETSKNNPISGFEAIMVGDYLDMSTAAVLRPKKEKRKTASTKSATKRSAKKEEKKESPTISPTHAFVGPPAGQSEAPPIPLQTN